MESMNNQELKYQIELGDALKRLEVNPDFVTVIKDGYIMRTLIQESQGMLDINPPIRQEALEMVQSVNYFRQFLTSIRNAADGAKQDLAETEV